MKLSNVVLSGLFLMQSAVAASQAAAPNTVAPVAPVAPVAEPAQEIKASFVSPDEPASADASPFKAPEKKVRQQSIVLTEKNTVILRGVVMDDTISNAIMNLSALKASTIYLFLDSPGGSVEAGDHLVNYLRMTDKNIVCVAQTAISMAFSILQACPTRVVMPQSVLMQHPASWGVKGEAPHISVMAKYTDRYLGEKDKLESSRMKLTVDQYQALVRNEYWVSGIWAVEENVADQLWSRWECSEALLERRDAVEMQQMTMFGPISSTMTYSGCPLMTAPIPEKKADKPKRDAEYFRDLLGRPLTDAEFQAAQALELNLRESLNYRKSYKQFIK